VLDRTLDARDGAQPVQCYPDNQPLPRAAPDLHDPKANDTSSGVVGSREAVLDERD
jgi:hypothetical protein